MGKGDIKTKRGKIVNKSYGVRRKRTKDSKTVNSKPVAVVKKQAIEVEEKPAVKKTTKKSKKEETE